VLQEADVIRVSDMADIDSREYVLHSEELFAILLEVVPKAGFNVKKIENAIRRIEVSTGMSWFSFGESLEIIVSSKGKGSILYVKSKAKIPWNMTSDVRGRVDSLFRLVDDRTKTARF
jgi:ubiquinone biosynthesis protein COQ9